MNGACEVVGVQLQATGALAGSRGVVVGCMKEMLQLQNEVRMLDVLAGMMRAGDLVAGRRRKGSRRGGMLGCLELLVGSRRNRRSRRRRIGCPRNRRA